MTAVEKPIEERLTERDRFANDVKSCCADLAETYCGDDCCVTCITDKLMHLGYRGASDVAREIFAEIEKIIGDKYECYVFDNINIEGVEQDAIIAFVDAMSNHFAELKKKYESEGGE